MSALAPPALTVPLSTFSLSRLRSRLLSEKVMALSAVFPIARTAPARVELSAAVKGATVGVFFDSVCARACSLRSRSAAISASLGLLR